jgi:hypothetical protein
METTWLEEDRCLSKSARRGVTDDFRPTVLISEPDKLEEREPMKERVLFVHRGGQGAYEDALYKEKLPRATIREFDGHGHQFNYDLSEVARDIKRM